MKKILLTATIVFAAMNALPTYAASIPKGLSTDHRIKVVMYDPNNLVVLQSRYGYQTQIVFAPNETINKVSIGDSIGWQAVPADNNLFLKPMAASRTDMSVLTNLNSYIFRLDSTNQNVEPTYKLQFIYPAGGFSPSGMSNAVGTFNPNNINWKYSFTGMRSIAPIEAFDDGKFTYFKFNTNGMSKLPAIFVVDRNRSETLVNYHMQGDYVVVNQVAPQFTFRNGNDVTSVYNDYLIGDWKRIS